MKDFGLTPMGSLTDTSEFNITMLYTQILSNPAMMEMFSDKELYIMMKSVHDYAVNVGINGVCRNLPPYREDVATEKVSQFKRTLGSGPKSNMF